MAGPYYLPDRLGPLRPGLLPFLGGPYGFDWLWEIEREQALRLIRPDQVDSTRLERLTRALDPVPLIRNEPLTFDRPQIMGIVNVTPDSFSDGGRHNAPDKALAHAETMIEGGAHILDIGGESTRPGAEFVSEQEELDRVLPVIEALKGAPVPLSIDTRRASVMRASVEAGASLINDVSGLSHDRDALSTAAQLHVPVILCHSQGTPQTMQNNPRYDHVLLDVYDWFADRLAACTQAGIALSHTLLDPGIGFGKTVEDNLALIRHLSLFAGLGRPLLMGLSRKRFIGTLSGEAQADRRGPGSLAANLTALGQGAAILRVHDVVETRQAVDIWHALRQDTGSL